MASVRPRWRHARIVVPLVFVLTVLPTAGLAWATWQLLTQDRGLVSRQRQDQMNRLNSASWLVVSDLRTILSESRRDLAAGKAWPAGAISITIDREGLTVTPPDRVAFLPVPVPLLAAPDDARRGAALLSRGQDLADSGRADEALRVFSEMRSLRPYSIEGTPSWLAARYKRGQILERTGRERELREEAVSLAADMRMMATHLNEVIYRTYAEDASRWMSSRSPQDAVSLSQAVGLLWQGWSSQRYGIEMTGHEVVWEDGDWKAVALLETTRDTLRAVVVTREFVDATWMPQLRSIARQYRATVVLGLPEAGNVPRSGQEAKDLPWPVVLYDASGSVQASGQRPLIVIGSFLTLIVVVAVAATWSIGRELAVARQQSNFVAAVSHEFRTPLTSLKHFVELLREQPSIEDARRRECYDAQARAVDRLSRLVESLLDFGRLEAGTQHHTFAALDCVALAQWVVDVFGLHAANAGYRIALSTSGSAIVNVDAEAFSRALWNLLDNAMKYSPPMSTIDVVVRAAHGNVCVDVVDRGIGVSPGESRDIFRRFHRGADARSRGIRGTGLGLAMVTEIMQAHGGRVDLESQPGQGSTFTLVFPAAA